MPAWPTTRVTLLDRIRDTADHVAWSEFVALYGPLVYAFARKRLARDEDAADVMQEVLCRVVKRSYDRDKGHFHKWLLTLTLNEIRDVTARRRRPAQAVGGTDLQRRLEEHPDEAAVDWEQDHQQRLFERAAECVEANTDPTLWQAFWQTSVEGKNGKEVAQALGMTVSNVYSAKSRILKQIREMVQEFEDA